MDELDLLLPEDSDYGFDPSDADMCSLSLLDVREQSGFKYPAMLLSNVLFTDCLRVLQSVKRESFRCVDLWIELPGDGGFQQVGSIQLDSDVLLLLGKLQIKVTMYYDENTVQMLDLTDPESIAQFI